MRQRELIDYFCNHPFFIDHMRMYDICSLWCKAYIDHDGMRWLDFNITCWSGDDGCLYTQFYIVRDGVHHWSPSFATSSVHLHDAIELLNTFMSETVIAEYNRLSTR